jgi:hypothetical protein
MSSTRRGVGPPAAFALVAHTTPTSSSTSAVSRGSSAMRTPIACGLSPVSHGKRTAGFGTTSVYGPGSSPSVSVTSSSGKTASSASRSAASSAIGFDMSRPFRR